MQQHCHRPSCPNEVEQAPGGHRPRLYCSLGCRVATFRERAAAAERERIRQEQEEQERHDRAELRRRFGDLLPATIDLLYELQQDYSYSRLVERVGQAIANEQKKAQKSALVEYGELSETILLSGEALGWPYLAIEDDAGGDLDAGLEAWLLLCNSASLERLRVVREAVHIKQNAIAARERRAARV